MALPNTNISTSLVGQTLGSSSRDVGTLCTHPNINKWSKWKPVRFNKLDGITESDIISAKSGIETLAFSSVSELINFYRSFSNDNYLFQYLRPRGGNNNPLEPYRIGDFRNYEHNARIFYIIDTIDATQFKSDNLDIWIGNNGTPDVRELNWNILSLSDCHWGAVIVRPTLLTPAVIAVSDLPIGESPSNYARVNLGVSQLISGFSYEAFTFLCTLDGEGTGQENITSFIPIENNKAGSFLLRLNRIESTLFSENLGGDSISGYDIKYTIELQNFSTEDINVTNATIRIRYADNPPLSALQPGEFEFALGTITVPAGQTVTRTGTAVGAVPQYSTRGGMAYFTNTYNSDINISAVF
jgi:hypothetical protein